MSFTRVVHVAVGFGIAAAAGNAKAAPVVLFSIASE